MNESSYLFLTVRDHSARPDFRLLHIQNIVERALMKINQFCFLHQKAEMHSFAAKFILDISEE